MGLLAKQIDLGLQAGCGGQQQFFDRNNGMLVPLTGNLFEFTEALDPLPVQLNAFFPCRCQFQLRVQDRIARVNHLLKLRPSVFVHWSVTSCPAIASDWR